MNVIFHFSGIKAQGCSCQVTRQSHVQFSKNLLRCLPGHYGCHSQQQRTRAQLLCVRTGGFHSDHPDGCGPTAPWGLLCISLLPEELGVSRGSLSIPGSSAGERLFDSVQILTGLLGFRVVESTEIFTCSGCQSSFRCESAACPSSHVPHAGPSRREGHWRQCIR